MAEPNDRDRERAGRVRKGLDKFGAGLTDNDREKFIAEHIAAAREEGARDALAQIKRMQDFLVERTLWSEYEAYSPSLSQSREARDG